MNDNGKSVAPAFSLAEGVDRIQTRHDFLELVDALAHDCEANPQEWENNQLSSFLEALGAFVKDMDGYFQNRGEAMPEQPTWKMLGQILLAARKYE